MHDDLTTTSGAASALAADGPLATTPEVAAPPAPAGAHEVVFEARGLDFHYGDFTALKGIDLRIMRNQVTALIGPSGSVLFVNQQGNRDGAGEKVLARTYAITGPWSRLRRR